MAVSGNANFWIRLAPRKSIQGLSMRLQTAPCVVWLALEKAALPPLPSNVLGVGNRLDQVRESADARDATASRVAVSGLGNSAQGA